MKNIGIYIHFPFCKSKCKYCNFNSYANKNDLQLDYFKSLIKEINMYRNSSINVDSVFIGGGTPSTMFNGCISTLISELRKNFNILPDAEITIEANPNSITKSKVIEWKDAGVNRVSVGLQSIKQSTLKLIGRTHTKQDYINSINAIKDGGIKNINTDCLIGLPRQKQSDVKKMLSLILKMQCTHVSVYSLILEEDTPLYKMVNSGEICLPSDEKTLGFYDFAYKYLKTHGYNRYEVSNFAREDCECRHNLNTWRLHEYLGFGAGAHGYFDNVRYNNISAIEQYITLLENNQKPIEKSENLTLQDKFEESVMLGLRTKDGIDLEYIKKEFDEDLLISKKSQIEYLLNNQLIEIQNNHLYATAEGFHVLNKIILDLVY